MKIIKIIACFSFMSAAESAFAYIDPGTGSMIIQGALGLVAAIIYFIRLYWAKIKSVFKRGKDQN